MGRAVAIVAVGACATATWFSVCAPAQSAHASQRQQAPPSIPPAPGPTSTPAPLRGALRIALERTGSGTPPWVFVGQHFVIHGLLSQYAARQRVTIRIFHGRQRLRTVTVGVGPARGTTGEFRLPVAVRFAGTMSVRADHPATSEQVALTARPQQLLVLSTYVGRGARGPTVNLLQRRLAFAHYAVPVNQTMDGATGRAVLAFRKVSGMARTETADLSMMSRLLHGGGLFHARYPRHGKHIEADLSRQVLAEIDPGGRVRRIYITSSGKPSTPTVLGNFHVYSQTPGVNAKGMLDSNYFIGGYAIHGYPEVPTFAASHGCLRIPLSDASDVFHWLRIGNGVDVYGRGGSHSGRADAGP